MMPRVSPRPSPYHSHGWMNFPQFVLLGPSLPHQHRPYSRAILTELLLSLHQLINKILKINSMLTLIFRC